MNVDIIGGGPAGAFFAILAKRNHPNWNVRVHERAPRSDEPDTGVALPVRAVDRIASHDPVAIDGIRLHSTLCNSIDVVFKEQSMRSFSEKYLCCSRAKFLDVLRQRAVDLGAQLSFGRPVSSLSEFDGSDLVVIADGMNSKLRDEHKDRFQPAIHCRSNKYLCLSSTAPLDGYKHVFRHTPSGTAIAHCFQYRPDRSTWVIEMDETTWRSFGFDRYSGDEMLAALQRVFAADLGGHALESDGSTWRNFSIVRNKKWVAGNAVLLGDARESSHYLQGSGVASAMQDAVALIKMLGRGTSLREVLVHWDGSKRDLGRVRHDADVSLARFEHPRRYSGMSVEQFAFGILTQVSKTSWEALALRDPALVSEVCKSFSSPVQGATRGDPADGQVPMFAPFRLRGMTIENRVVVSPMDQYSSVDGLAGDWHFLHLCSRAIGGAGLVCVEMTAPSPDGRISPGDAGLWNEQHRDAFKRIVDFCHANSKAKLCMQLGHAGRKGSTQLSWQRIDHPLEHGNWPLVSASPIPYMDGISQVPREAQRDDMDRLIADFRRSTRLSNEAKFDMLELHMAHGYLLASFISPLTNKRSDEYGGSIQNRMRFPLELFCACREEWPDEKPMAVRISAADWAPGGLSVEDLIAVASMFKDAGCDLIDCSSGQTVPYQKPAYGGAYQSPFSELVRNEVGIPTIAVGGVATPDQVNVLLASGTADLVALARPHMANPYFTLHAAAWYQHQAQYWPPQYHFGRGQALQQAARDRTEWTELHSEPDGRGFQ